MDSMTSKFFIFIYELLLLIYYDNPFNSTSFEEACDKIDKRSKK